MNINALCCGYIVVVVKKTSINSTSGNVFTSLNTHLFNWPSPHATIDIPVEEFEDFVINGTITTISTAIRNATVFFSNELTNNTS